MKRGYYFYNGVALSFLFIGILFICPPVAQAQTVDLSGLSAQGVAIYGWRNSVPTVLYVKKQQYLFPLASMTKLVTAKAVEQLYPENMLFTISQDAMANKLGSSDGILPGMIFNRDDLLRALLVSSNNGAGTEFSESVGSTTFLATMNTFLHNNGYTQTNFINPTGLDPTVKNIAPNRLTPKSLSYLLNSVYTQDPLLTSILEEKSAVIVDQASGASLPLASTDELNYDPLYNNEIILGKTGTTNLAGQNLAFVTNGAGAYDYVTVVFMNSKNREQDGKLILDWLQMILHYNQ